MIRYRSGSLLDSPAQTLVNTVNCVGVMGKGIALEFKRRYPAMFKEYAKMCNRGQVHPGVPYCYSGEGRQIINFPTKSHWKAKSRIEDVERGLEILRTHYRDWNVESIAVPPLGCGNGGLNWDDVHHLIERYLGDLPIEVLVYAPGALSSAESTTERSEPQMTLSLEVQATRNYFHS